MLAASCTPSSVRFPPGREFPVDGTPGCSPRLPLLLPGEPGKQRAHRHTRPGPGASGGFPRGSPFSGRGSLGRPGMERALPWLPDESCSFPPGAAARPSTVSDPRDCHLRERATRAPHPAATCVAQLAPSGQPAEWVTAPPAPSRLRRGLPPWATGGRKGASCFPRARSGAPRRLGRPHLRPWASTCSHARWWEPGQQGPAASPALPPRQTQNHSAAATKPSRPQTSAEAAGVRFGVRRRSRPLRSCSRATYGSFNWQQTLFLF